MRGGCGASDPQWGGREDLQCDQRRRFRHCNPKRVKEQTFHTRQCIAGHEIRELKSWGDAESDAANWGQSVGENWSWGDSKTKPYNGREEKSESTNRGDTTQRMDGRSKGHTQSENTHQQLVPVHEEVSELAGKAFFSGDDWERVWSKRIRKLQTSEALVRLVNDSKLHRVNVERSTPGILGFDMATITSRFPQALERVQQFVEENFRSEFFVTPQVVERETEERIQAVLRAATAVHADAKPAPTEATETDEPFSE